MPPPLPSSPSGPAASGRATKSATKTPTTSRRPGSSASIRRPSVTSVSSARNATPRTQQSTVATPQRATKVRGSSDKENTGDPKPLSSSTRRQTSSSIFTREKLPSKDGTAQRNAKEVDGLKDYQLGDCLGKGASGAVYRALNWSTGETVAIKQISLANLQKNELNVIMQEIDLLKNLEHPNIVKYHNFVKSTDSLYIILEYCENGSLHTICKNFGKFPENLVSLYTAQVLQGLLFLHEQGVIHRDIKGANILTTKEGLVKLADFGVATKQQNLSDGSVVGTPYWMAPEVIELSGASTASDIWSLGCTVIELIDGKPPYHKLAPMPALFRIVNDDHPPLPEGCSPLVRSFLKECFQKDPNLRVSAKKLLNHPWIKAGKGGPKRNKDPDEAIKEIQDWNSWLRSSPKERDSNVNGSRRVPTKRPISRGTTKAPKSKYETPPANPPRNALRAGRQKAQVAKHFASPEEEDKSDVWDDDFEQLTAGIGALSLPEHLKPHDELSLFTSEKLKQFASVDGVPETDGKVEEWDDHFEGDLTVKPPLELAKGDALETVRSFYPPRASTSDIKHKPPATLAPRDTSFDQSRRPSRDSQPRTQILRPAQKPPQAVKQQQQQQQQQQTPLKLIKKPSPSSALHKESYREDEDEDYSDLIPEDEAAFQRKLAGFSPNRPFDPKHLRNMSRKLGGSVRHRNHTPSSLVHDAAAMRRTRSSLEIQKYAEDEDDDFADVLFHSDDEAPMHLHSAKQRSPQSASLGSESTGSERGTLKLSGSLTWEQDDEEEDDDPFAALEEELDAVDLESNVARDKLARLVTHVEGLVSDLKLSQTEDALANIADELFLILSESPDVKTVIVSSHGMLPILEILETCTRSGTILRLLRIVNTVIYDNVEVQENMCFVGGIPIISKFAQKKYSADIRVEAAAFVRMMYQTSTLTLQMFVSCGGLNVLVEFLEEDYDTEAGQELVLVGVNGVWSVFELQGPTPKNDFCRIFSRSSVLYPLSLVLNRVLDKESPDDEIIEGRIVNIFLLFSQAENYVKETVADRMVLKRVLKDLRRMSPAHQVTMLKFIKNLSMLATTLDALQNSNAIEVLTDLLGANMHAPHSREISNQVLNTMFNLCRLSKARQEDAALSGLIPLLQRIVQTDRPLKEFALPILCDMAHSGKVGRKVLWQNKGLAFYVSLLADQYWAVTALDAIFVWLQEETSKVEEHLLATPAFKDAIVQCFNESKGDTFENLLDPLVKILRLTPAVAASLAHRSLFERTAMKLHAKKPLVRLNLLRVIRSICDASEEQGTLLRTYGLLESVEDLAESDPAILVKEMAKDVIKSSKHTMQPPTRQYAGLRRTSSSMSTPPIIIPSAGGSMPPTPVNGERRGSYFELGLELESRHARVGIPASSPYRPVSRGNSSSSLTSAASQPQWSSGSAASGLLSGSKSSSRLSVHPRPSLAGANLPSRPGSRMSLAPPGPPAAAGGRRLSTVEQSLGSSSSSNAGGVDVGEQKDMTPTHAPLSAGTRSGMAVANAAARRRRQNSAVAELNGKA